MADDPRAGLQLAVATSVAIMIGGVTIMATANPNPWFFVGGAIVGSGFVVLLIAAVKLYGLEKSRGSSLRPRGWYRWVLSFLGLWRPTLLEDDSPIWGLPWNTGDNIRNLRFERQMRRFAIIQRDGAQITYSGADVDNLAESQRTALFSHAPEMKAWWYGRPQDEKWTHFRLPGGRWVYHDLLNQATEEARRAVWDACPELLTWYLSDPDKPW